MFAAVSRRVPAMTPCALACALLFSCTASAADTILPAITVTGPRFDSAADLAPIGATVITAEAIRRAGASDVNQAIRKIGGVYGRQSLDASPDFGLDLRGFGANSNQNVVIMLDGVRLSENELSSAVLSSIPIESVERIEIIRGGASVLYGDGASGGVIQIVTKRPAANARRGSLRAEGGEFGLRDLRASYAQSWDGFALDAAIGHLDTDNFREHNAYKQNNFSGGAQWAYSGGRAGLRYARTRSEAQYPGSLSLAQFQTKPRMASTPEDQGALEGDRASAFVQHQFGALELAAELSRREKTVRSTYVYTSQGATVVSKAVYDSAQTQFSPRLRHLAEFGPGLLNELVAGIDIARWTRVADSGYSNADATQKSRAVYVRDELKWGAARLSAGARRERFDKTFTDVRGFATPYDTEQTQNAWEVQGSYAFLPQVTGFIKTGRSYRVANADENGYRSSMGVLALQTSRDIEAGASVGPLTARVFRHRLVNEIFYDPTLNGGWGANTNLDPTERKGAELEVNGALAPGWRASASVQHVLARFTAGPNAGRDMVLVPKNVVSARLTWTPAGGHTADLGAQWVDRQRYGGDFDNSCGARIPGYTTIDARYAYQFGPWELAVAGLNLADKRYYSNAFACRGGIYPSDGRQLKLALRYDF